MREKERNKEKEATFAGAIEPGGTSIPPDSLRENQIQDEYMMMEDNQEDTMNQSVQQGAKQIWRVS